MRSWGDSSHHQASQLNARRAKRMKADYLIKFRLSDMSEAYEASNIRDFSANGVRFISGRFMVEGTPFQMSILIPPIDRRIDCQARVVRCRRAEEANFFFISAVYVNMADEDCAAMVRFVERLALHTDARHLID